MELLSIFTKIGDWFSDQANTVIVGLVASFIIGFVTKRGWSKMIDRFSQKAKIITKEFGEMFLESSDFFSKVDDSIRDDGTIDQNSLKEALKAGKEVYIEGKDVIASFKPKKALNTPKTPIEKIKQKRSKYRHK